MSCSSDWATASVPDTGHISLWDQVESELEARFAKALEDWAAGVSRVRSVSSWRGTEREPDSRPAHQPAETGSSCTGR